MDSSYIILVLIIITVSIVIYYNTGDREMVYVKSNVDGENYMVRNNSTKQQASNILATIKANIYAVTNYMYNRIDTPKYKNHKQYVQQLHDKIQNVVVRESSSNSVYTSYTINKGESIVFCIRSKDITKTLEQSNIHDLNLLMYVALHEISHVACPEKDHTPLFKNIFNFICLEAVEMNLYKKIDFRANPTEYCGMTITDSII
ncbi:MAG: protein of unknown function DUF45 [Dasosvirus sp.]|uniref:WLM domain-containing protein n=1 Tax=Dasosvirus sp. TaxID=2487764 RepID=A0A3G4ZRQ3_9VIRU|nr:MAG: protein of unknown function DUF45 [Dasosvirus sp.]